MFDFSFFHIETDPEKLVNMGIVIILIIFFLIATERIAEGFVNALKATFNFKLHAEIDDELAQRSSRAIAALFLVPASLFTATPNLATFLWVLIGLIAYLAVKYGIMAILDYVNQTETFKFIGRMGINYLTIAATLLFLARININFSALCIIPYVLYLVTSSRIIFKNNYSVFFYILYLCSLELLPAALLIRLFL